MKRISRLLGCLLLFTMLFGVDNIRSGMAQTPPPISPRIEWREHIQDLPYYPDPAPVFTNETDAFEPQAITSDLPEWSSIVFQSLRDDNWEIYLANGDGGDQQRLTADPAADIHPRLNRGCTHVIFASQRTGNYEIFSIRLSDLSLQQLTFTSSDDVYPMWSPDGSKIAFQSYRDGQAEVYVMNADGSGQTRLTVDAGYDGEPAWSPDGARIAFVSARAGTSHIWVMNSNGSGATQLSTQRYSENPAWSPDGSQIAYDADGNGDGWQEVWIMHKDGSNQRKVYATGSQTDVWVGSWSPDGNYIAFTKISFIYYQGNWYWTKATLGGIDTQGNYVRGISYQGTDWNPDWQTKDLEAPHLTMQILPAYTQGVATIKWWSTDNLSGIKGYDVQYRDASSGTWQNLLTQTTAQQTDFPGTPSRTYYFRSRAVDNSCNSSPWSAENVHTTFYTWAISSTVKNNRGGPARDVQIATSPNAFTIDKNERAGVYTAYVADSANFYTTTWQKGGYAELPPITFSGDEDAEVEIVVPPSDNVIADWGFESEDRFTDTWEVAGIIPPVSLQNAAHSGQFGVRLGQQLALQQQKISTVTDHSFGESSVAFDNTGHVHIAWRQTDLSTDTLLYTHCSPEGVCQPVQIVDTSSYHNWSNTPSLMIGSDNTPHIVWQGGPQMLQYTYRLPNGLWSTPEDVLADVTGEIDAFQLGLDSHNTPHVVWCRYGWDWMYYGTYYSYMLDDGTWSSERLLSREGKSSFIAISATDNLYFAWYDEELRASMYQIRLSNGSWSPVQEIQEDLSVTSMMLDSEENLHVVGMNGMYQIVYMKRDLTNSWSPPQPLPDRGMGTTGMAYIASPLEQYINVVWTGAEDGKRWLYLAYLDLDTGIWKPPLRVADTAFGGQISIDVFPSTNEIALSSRDYSSIYLARFEMQSENADQSTLTQVVNIPEDLQSPTLSFFYQVDAEQNRSDKMLLLIQSDTESLSYTLEPTSGWRHHWLDASQWAGETITVTFSVSQTIDGFATWAYLDEVTLGSASPDIWISGCDTMVVPGDEIVCSLQYGNQGSLAAENTQIILTLPGSLIFVDSTPAPDLHTLMH